MSYDKQNWQTGDVITANKLNHIEDGIAGAGGGGVLVVNVTTPDQGQTFVADKTFEQLSEAYSSGQFIMCNIMNAFGAMYFDEGGNSFTASPMIYSQGTLVLYGVWIEEGDTVIANYDVLPVE